MYIWANRLSFCVNTFYVQDATLCFTDVLFQVDDGTVAAHRALLMSCCDVMQGMFSYNFKESCAKVVRLYSWGLLEEMRQTEL